MRDALRHQTRAVIHVLDRQPVRRDFRWKRELGDASRTLAVVGVGLFSNVPPFTSCIESVTASR